MTPIKWDASNNEITTTASDTAWYDYSAKKWANAKTADGSYWVWIPRFAYKMSNGFHSSTAGTFSIKFLKGVSNTTSDSTSIQTSGYLVGTKDTSNNYFMHPAFDFGGNILGYWVAKFEASGFINAVDIKPGVVSLKNLIVDSMFTACMNMKNNSRYGWNASINDMDTHLIKNIEWGAVSYLSNSLYGKNSEIWVNPNSNYITGQAGTTVNAAATTTTYAYNNAVYGINASTTGNAYGIYDMSGGAWEYVASFVNNGNSLLTTNASTLIASATDEKYKDIYQKGSNDDNATNYLINASKMGDAVYETSLNGGDVNSTSSWYTDFSNMPRSTSPFFMRGGRSANAANAGIFAFTLSNGNASIDTGFRPILIITGH
jgi:hypothetical protein